MSEEDVLEVEVLLASCCNREQIEKRVQPILQQMKNEISDLTWKFTDIEEEPELMIKYAVPTTPAILIDRKLEFVGLPERSRLELKIRERAGKRIHS